MIVSTEACINSNNHKKLPQGPAALRESLSSCPYVAIRMYRSTLMRNLSHTRSQCAPPVERWSYAFFSACLIESIHPRKQIDHFLFLNDIPRGCRFRFYLYLDLIHPPFVVSQLFLVLRHHGVDIDDSMFHLLLVLLCFCRSLNQVTLGAKPPRFLFARLLPRNAKYVTMQL